MTKDWYPDVQRTPTTQWKDNSFFKIEKRFKQPLHERKYALGQKAHEKYSTSSYHYTPSRMPKISKNDKINDIVQQEFSYITGGNVKYYNHPQKRFVSF